MVDLLLLLFGATAGFVGSRTVRRRALRAAGPGRTTPAVGSAAAVASAARSVGGSLGRRKGLTPPELQRACFSELARHVHKSRRGPTVVPSRFIVDLHPDDLATVDESRKWFTDGLVDAMRDAAAQNGWVIDGDLTITYQSDPSRRPGVPTAHPIGGTGPDEDGSDEPEPVEVAAAPAVVPDGPVPTPAPRAARWALVRDDSGERIDLDPTHPALVIGRSRTADVVVDDNRVSRQHARIEPTGDGGWAVVDLGSSNGSLLDRRPLTPHTKRDLRAGSVLQVGPVRFTVEAGR